MKLMVYHPPQRRNRNSAGSDRKPVIWTVSVSRLSGLLNDVTPEYDDRALIEPINLGFEEAVRHIRRRLVNEDCDVLIAAGSNGAYLKNRIDKPVVLVRLSGFDLMQALARARKLSPRIGLVTHASDLPEFAEFQRGFGLSIEQRTFVTAEDARTCVAELVAKGVKVIVGTGLATELAEQAGVPGILLYSAETIRAAFDAAIDIAGVVHDRQDFGLSIRASRRVAVSPQVRFSVDDLLGKSALMANVREAVLRCARSAATLLISGATGTGKELVAQAVHAGSARRTQPFVAVNCGAIAESLLESELFGYDEGAFTGSRRGGRAGLIEAADGGTLFLDEIGEMPLALQTRLLRALEERQILRVGSSRPVAVNIRVIAATHCDLPARVAAHQFRADLFFRLNVLQIALPNLAERPQDLPLLAQSFLQRSGETTLPFSADALRLLRRHAWPGNVRELRNVMERLSLHGNIDGWPARIDAAYLLKAAPELAEPPSSRKRSIAAAIDAELMNSTRPAVRPSPRELEKLIRSAHGNRRTVAAHMRVSRTTLWRWLREAGI